MITKINFNKFNFNKYLSLLLLTSFLSFFSFNFNTYCMQQTNLLNKRKLEELEQKALDGNLDLIIQNKLELENIKASILQKIKETRDNNMFRFLLEQIEQAIKEQERKAEPLPKEPAPVKQEREKEKQILEKQETEILNHKYFYNLVESLKIEVPNYSDYCVKLSFAQKDLKKYTPKNIDALKTALLSIRHGKAKMSQKEIPVQEHGKSVMPELKEYIKPTITESIEAMLKSKHPELCMFSECSCVGSDKREAFDIRVNYHKAFSAIGNNINYMGLGCGELFPDLKLLVRLIDNGKKIKTIHLVDTYYQPIIDVLKNAAKTGNFKIIENQNQPAIFMQIVQVAQFLKILSDLQQEPINLIIHQDAASYLDACKQDESIKANLITIIDFGATTIIGGPSSTREYHNLDVSIGNLGPKKDSLLCIRPQNKEILINLKDITENGLSSMGILCLLTIAGESIKVKY